MSTVVITDWTFPDLSVEEGIFNAHGIRCVARPCKTEADLSALCAEFMWRVGSRMFDDGTQQSRHGCARPAKSSGNATRRRCGRASCCRRMWSRVCGKPRNGGNFARVVAMNLKRANAKRAAERRQKVAHGASRGWRGRWPQAPEGRQNGRVARSRLERRTPARRGSGFFFSTPRAGGRCSANAGETVASVAPPGLGRGFDLPTAGAVGYRLARLRR